LEVGTHADLSILTECVEQSEQTGETGLSELCSQLAVDRTRCFSLGREVFDPAGGEGHGLLPAAGFGICDPDIVTLPEVSDDLGGALAGDTEFSPDCRDRRSRRRRTEAEDAAVREPTVIEARGRHGSVES
jgi:hypothetical protein